VPPRPAPDLDSRRELITRTARTVAESEGWAAVTMRRLAGELGVTQPVLYSAFTNRQALVDAVALDGFDELAAAMEAVETSPRARMSAYLDFAATRPQVYEAMFSLPSGLTFAVGDRPEPRRAFAALGAAFPTTGDGTDGRTDGGTRTEVVWSLLHGLATLDAAGRLAPGQARARLDLAHRMLTQPSTSQENPS
jgi:AcrR family transcriptional regulator